MKKKHSNIIIFSRPIQTGKTTELFTLINKLTHINGILTPVVNGQRLMYDIATKTYFPFEKQDSDQKESVAIGKYLFYAEAFERGKEILLQHTGQGLFIVDEAGRLEVHHNTGLEPALGTIIHRYKASGLPGKLLLVVRDSLLENALQKYSLDCPVINNLKNAVF